MVLPVADIGKITWTVKCSIQGCTYNAKVYFMLDDGFEAAGKDLCIEHIKDLIIQLQEFVKENNASIK